jgi:hypothetical protein
MLHELTTATVHFRIFTDNVLKVTVDNHSVIDLIFIPLIFADDSHGLVHQSCVEWMTTERKVIEGLVFAITVRVATYFE